MIMEEKHYCGECVYMESEDTDGYGYCLLKDLYTFVRCSDPACEVYFTERKD